MKLTDLRDELTARADSTDETPDLLDGVHRKITQTKRRRKAGAAGAVGGVAVIAAFAFGILPALTTSTPQPAEDDVPRDYTKDGLILHGLEGEDRLEKGWIGDRGDKTLDFTWTPKAQETRFAGYCNTYGHHLTILVNDYVVGTTDCITEPDPDSPGTGISLPADSALWLAAPAGKPARVVVQLTDENGRPAPDQETQVALGIYRTVSQPPAGPPTQAPPTSATDYVKDGVRYRAKIGGDTLLGALVADRGESSFEFTFTANGGPIKVTDFCTATSPGDQPQYQVAVKFNGDPIAKTSCSVNSLDAGGGSSWMSAEAPPPAGQRVTVSVRLEDNAGRPVSKPNDWIGLGIYAKGKQRTIGDTSLDEVREYNGHNYRLAEVKTAEARTTKDLEIVTPAGRPFLVAYGSTTVTGDVPTVRVSGLTGASGSTNSGGGIGLAGEAARPAGTAAVNLSTGKYTSGKLIIALYLPAD